MLSHGHLQPLGKALELKAGCLSMLFENGFLRYIRHGELELIRMINHAIRDENWETIPIDISDLRITNTKDSFDINYKAVSKSERITFTWTCSIRGRCDHTIQIELHGKASNSFLKNRLGFTVLHPISSCQGRQVVVKGSDGTRRKEQFPNDISPHQPFIDIQEMNWTTSSGDVKLIFEGDTFEMEDQRNWGDSSFKTYCTPLSNPMPVHIQHGDRVSQQIIFEYQPKDISQPNENSLPLSFSVGDKLNMPKIGVCASREIELMTTKEINLINQLSPDHYSVELKLYEDDWKEEWLSHLRNASELRVPLACAIFTEFPEKEIDALIEVFKQASYPIANVSLFHRYRFTSDANVYDKFLPGLKRDLPGTTFGTGTDAFFTQLNRDRPSAGFADYATFSFNPTVHADDNRTMVENLETPIDMVKTLRAFQRGKSVHISPVTLSMRWSPDALNPEDIPSPPSDLDSRLMSLFGASWTLGLVCSLCRARVDSTSLFETVGSRGIVQSDKPKFTEFYSLRAGYMTPTYLLLKEVAQHKTKGVRIFTFNKPLSAAGMGFGGTRNLPEVIILGNFSGEYLEISSDIDMHAYQWTAMDSTNVMQLISGQAQLKEFFEVKGDPILGLTPYALIFGYIRED